MILSERLQSYDENIFDDIWTHFYSNLKHINTRSSYTLSFKKAEVNMESLYDQTEDEMTRRNSNLIQKMNPKLLRGCTS